MTVAELQARHEFKILAMPNGQREIQGAYVGDLLSWVMGRASEGQAWITIMSNQNIVAVASLLNVACIILAEDVVLPEEIVASAETKGVNILKTCLPTYETAALLAKDGI